MAKQLNVDMRFNADTSQAKASIQDLQRLLTEALSQATIGAGGTGISAEINKAKIAAAELKVKLQDAMRTDGSLDLVKFNNSLQASGKTLSQYGTALAQLGPSGKQAFLELTQSISSANIQFQASNSLVNQLWVTLKNVARFQITSSALHTFIGGIQSAYGYAQGLNESLNNIRIVTGQNIEQVAKFAQTANKSARQLSATTLDYTNASLIYYQQGLDDAAVAERTATTLKLANVSRQSAETVSEQMTAIWNNFDDGSHSLEYYADVITALGAKTASSSAEIATGLSKFAAVADTVGLSYENATAALATIVATTRQSADTVGTGLRTLFSRLQGLKLGETLEDGVDLNKYSAALKTVGVDALDATGELRSMDNILEDLGEKWKTLSDSQQVALAQTVGGVRQYTTLIALMDNWDFFKQNQGIAGNAAGTLQDQADIYAESWEASRDRVKAAAEAIHKALIDEDFFIGLNDGLEKGLDGVANLIKALGGLPGVLATVSTAFLTAFGPQLSQGIDNLIQRIQFMSGKTQDNIVQMKIDANNQLASMYAGTKGTSNNIADIAYKSQAEASNAILQQQLSTKQALSAEEAKIANLLQQQHNLLVQNAVESGKELEQAQKKFDLSAARTKALGNNQNTKDFQEDFWVKNALSRFQSGANLAGTEKGISFDTNTITILKEQLNDMENEARRAGISLQESLGNAGYSEPAIQALLNLRTALKGTNPDIETVREKMLALANVNSSSFNSDQLNNYIQQLKTLSTESANLQTATNAFSRFDNMNGLKPEDLQALQTAIEGVKQAAGSTKPELEKAFGDPTVAEKLLNLENVLKNFPGDTAQATQAMQEFQQALNDAKNGKNSTAIFENIRAELRKIIPDEKQVEQIIKDLENEFNNLSGAEANATQSTANLGTSFAQLKTFLASVKGEIQTIGQGLTGLATGLSGLAGVVNGLKGLKDIWKDEDSSFGNKMLSSVSSISMIIFSATRMMDGFSKVPDMLGSLFTVVSQGAITAADSLMGYSAAQTAAGLGTASFGEALLVLGPIIAGVAAVVGVLVYGIYELYRAYNADAIAAKNAAEAAESLNKKSQKTAQAAQQIKSAFSNYDTAVDALRSCTKGTEEWNTALEKVNSEILSILENNPELAKQMKLARDENGMLSIENRDEIISQAEEKASAAQAAAVLGKTVASEKALEADQTRVRREFTLSATTATTDEEALAISKMNTTRYSAINNAKETNQWTTEQWEQFSKEAGMAGEELTNFKTAISQLANSTDQVASQIKNTSQIIAESKLGDKFSDSVKGMVSGELKPAYDKIYNDILEESDKYKKQQTQKDLDRDDSIWGRYLDAIGEDFNTTLYKLADNAIQGEDDNRTYHFIDAEGKAQSIRAEEMAAAIAAAEALSQLTGSAEAAAEALANIKAPKGTNNEEWNSFAANKDFRDWTGNEINAIKGQFSDFAANYNPDDWKGKIKTGNKDQAGNDIMRDAASAEDAFLSTIYNGLGLSGEHVAAFRTGVEDSKSYLETYYANVAKARQLKISSGGDADSEQIYYDALKKSPGAAGLLALNENQQNAITRAGMSHAISAFDKAGAAGGTVGASLLGNLLNNVDPSELDNIVAQLDKYDASTWINVDLNDITDLPGLIASLQTEADSNPIEIRAKLDLLEGAKDALKEGMSSTEWKDYFNQYGDTLGLTDAGSQADFMGMDYEDQQTYIESQAYQQKILARNELNNTQNRINALTAANTGDEYDISALTEEDIELISSDDPDKAERIAEAIAQARLEAEMLKADLEEAGDKFHSDDFSDEEYEEIEDVAENFREMARARAESNELSADFADTNSEIIDQSQALVDSGKEQLDITEEQREAIPDLVDENEELIDAQQRTNELLAEDPELAEKWAEHQAKVNRGIKKLQSNYKNIAETLETMPETSGEWLGAMDDLRRIIADITKSKFKNITKGFAKAAKESGLLEKAAKGDQKALKQLQKEAQKLKIGQTLAKQGKIGEKALKDLENAENFDQLNQAFDTMCSEMDAKAQELGLEMPASFADMIETANEMISNTPPGEPLPPDTTAYLSALAMMVYQTTNSLQAVQDVIGSFGATLKVTPQTAEFENNQDVELHGVRSWIDEINTINYGPGNDEVQHAAQDATITGFTIEGTPDAEPAIQNEGGGGGGGGGGSKPKAPKPHKKSDMSKRYHRVNEQINDRKREQDEAERRKDRAFGQEKLDQLQKEINLRKQNLDLQKQYIDQINGFLKGDREALVAAMGEVQLKVEFDDEGVITNYQELEDNLLAQENWLIDVQNMYEQMGEDVPIWVELYQRKIDDAREYLDRYEETLNLLEEQMNATSEQIDELSDALFEIITTKVELNIGINDDEASRLEYFLTKYEDNAYKAAEAIAVFGDQAENSLKRIGIYQEGINDLLASKGLTLADLQNLDDEGVRKLIEEGDFTQEQVDSMREWRDGLLEANEAMLELRTNIAERVLDTFDQLNEKVENSYDLFDHYNSVLETYKDITDLLGQQINKEQRQLIDNLNNSMLENQKNATIAAKARYDDLVEERVRAQELYDTALAEGGEDAAQKYEEMLQSINEALRDAEEGYLEAWQETMDQAQTIFETTIENIMKDFEAAMSGAFGSLDYLQEAFDRQGELDENYLDDYDKLYELNKLQREINKTLSDTRSVTNRKALLDLQAKINEYQENGVQLSQYDVDALRAKFELQQAYNDMMLARDAKSTVRLSRDNEGNWGYVYTANQDEVEEAEQAYEDKLHEYQKLNDEYIQELQEKALEVQTTYRDTLQEIMSDVTLTDEERDARVKELNDWLMAQQDYFAQQSENVFANQSETFDRMLNTYNVNAADLVDSWDDTRISMLTGFQEMADYMTNWQNSSTDYLNNLQDALAQRTAVMDDILQTTGSSIETYGKDVDAVIERVGKASDETRQQVIDLAKVLNEEFGEAIDSAISWEKEYAAKMNAAIDANERMVKSVNDLIAALADISSYNHIHDELNKFLQDSKDYELGKMSPEEFTKRAQEFGQSIDDFVSLDEGGYTGSWGPDGRIALLHEKENVFNAEDTQNLLDAAQLLRQIDMSTAYMAAGFGTLSGPNVGETGMVFEQYLTIEEVSFPNATDREEIEEAFSNLANQAIQYANRKNE